MKIITEFLNLWRPFPKVKPTERGWYIVTIEVEGQQRYTRELFWYPERQAFWDNIREEMSETYNIRGGDGRRLDNSYWDKTSYVVAWKKCQKTYMKGFVLDEWNSRYTEKYKKGGKYERSRSFKNGR